MSFGMICMYDLNGWTLRTLCYVYTFGWSWGSFSGSSSDFFVSDYLFEALASS